MSDCIVVPLGEAFEAANPPETWVELSTTCDGCGETVTAKLPAEVRATEWCCKCGKSVTLYMQEESHG